MVHVEAENGAPTQVAGAPSIPRQGADESVTSENEILNTEGDVRQNVRMGDNGGKCRGEVGYREQRTWTRASVVTLLVRPCSRKKT